MGGLWEKCFYHFNYFSWSFYSLCFNMYLCSIFVSQFFSYLVLIYFFWQILKFLHLDLMVLYLLPSYLFVSTSLLLHDSVCLDWTSVTSQPYTLLVFRFNLFVLNLSLFHMSLVLLHLNFCLFSSLFYLPGEGHLYQPYAVFLLVFFSEPIYLAFTNWRLSEFSHWIGLCESICTLNFLPLC